MKPVTSLGVDSPASPSRSAAALLGDPPLRVTGYEGYEAAILALRNANRSTAQTRQYLDWRYSRPTRENQAEVYWIGTVDQPLGMAALIPRTYWLDGERQDVGVLGDISLDASLRGRGMGKSLLGFVTATSQQRFPQRLNFVLPTEAARRALAAIGWRNGGCLIQHVLLLDPSPQLSKLVGRHGARILASAYRAALGGLLSLADASRAVLESSPRFDPTFDILWRDFPKQGLCLGDRSVATLQWRYADHPDHDFQIAALRDSVGLRGYVIYEIVDSSCSIYDVLAATPRDLSTLLARLVRTMLRRGVLAVRILLSDTHPYRRVFLRLGFISRESVVFQYHDPTPKDGQVAAGSGSRNFRWMLTQGDKDI